MEEGLIGRHDGFRYPSRCRCGLADRVGQAHRGLARIMHDVGVAEELTQDALIATLKLELNSGSDTCK
jgi:hypothetical protein